MCGVGDHQDFCFGSNFKIMSHIVFRESILLKDKSFSSLVSAHKTDIIPKNNTCCDRQNDSQKET